MVQRMRLVGLATMLGCLLAVPARAETTNLFGAPPPARTPSSDPMMLTVSFTLVHVFFDNYPGFSVGVLKPYSDKITLVGELSYNRPHVGEAALATSLLSIVVGGRYVLHMKSPKVEPYAQMTFGISHVSDQDNFYGTAVMYAPGIGATFAITDKVRGMAEVEWRSHKHAWKWTAGVAIPIMTKK